MMYIISPEIEGEYTLALPVTGYTARRIVGHCNLAEELMRKDRSLHHLCYSTGVTGYRLHTNVGLGLVHSRPDVPDEPVDLLLLVDSHSVVLSADGNTTHPISKMEFERAGLYEPVHPSEIASYDKVFINNVEARKLVAPTGMDDALVDHAMDMLEGDPGGEPFIITTVGGYWVYFK